MVSNSVLVSGRGADDTDQARRLLAVLAEQLQVPLLQIARLAEKSGVNDLASLETIATLSTIGLELTRHYTLLLSNNATLLGPVAISSVLYKTAQRLEKLAHLYHCDLQLELAAHLPSVVSNAASLEAAFSSLGAALIEAQANNSNHAKRTTVVLAAHKSRWGLVAGLYGDALHFTKPAFHRSQNLVGQARQPLNQTINSAGAGIFLADALLESVATGLHPARYHKRNGLAATLQPSQQLSFV